MNWLRLSRTMKCSFPLAALAALGCGGSNDAPPNSGGQDTSSSSGAAPTSSSGDSGQGGSSSGTGPGGSSGANEPDPDLEPDGPNRVTLESVQDANGATHNYLLVVPRQRAEGPLPIVLSYHGDGGDGPGQRNYMPFEQTSGNGAIVVYPSRPGGWDVNNQSANNGNLAGFDAIVEKVAAEHQGDRAKVSVFGWSNGGFFAHLIGCHRGGKVHAIASMAGGYPWDTGATWPGTSIPRCEGQQPTRVLVIHGVQDDVGGKKWPAQAWAHVNRCGAAPAGCQLADAQFTADARVPCQNVSNVPADKPVRWCAIPNMGHQIWDQAGAASWDFFSAP